MKDDKKKVNQKETLLKVLVYIRPYKFLMALTIIMAALSVALTLYLPILTGDAVDWLIYIFDPSSLNVASPWPALFFILKKMAIVILLTAITQWIMNICNNKIVYIKKPKKTYISNTFRRRNCGSCTSGMLLGDKLGEAYQKSYENRT